MDWVEFTVLLIYHPGTSLIHGLYLVVRWACDDTVTHYIYQGRVGDNSREYKAVKERGLHVVSQHWLHAVSFHSVEIRFKGEPRELFQKDEGNSR